MRAYTYQIVDTMPMVAPSYAARWSEFAKATRLENSRRKAAYAFDAAVDVPARDAVFEPVEPPAKRRGRPKKLDA